MKSNEQKISLKLVAERKKQTLYFKISPLDSCLCARLVKQSYKSFIDKLMKLYKSYWETYETVSPTLNIKSYIDGLLNKVMVIDLLINPLL